MAEKIAGVYRTSKLNDDGTVEHTVLRPGDDVKGIADEDKEDLKGSKLVVDEKRLTEDGLRKTPEQVEDEEETLPRFTPVRTPQSQFADNRDEETRQEQAGGETRESVNEDRKQAKSDKK